MFTEWLQTSKQNCMSLWWIHVPFCFFLEWNPSSDKPPEPRHGKCVGECDELYPSVMYGEWRQPESNGRPQWHPVPHPVPEFWFWWASPVSLKVTRFPRWSKHDLDLSRNKYFGFIFDWISAHNITQISGKLKSAKLIQIIDSQKYTNANMFN